MARYNPISRDNVHLVSLELTALISVDVLSACALLYESEFGCIAGRGWHFDLWFMVKRIMNLNLTFWMSLNDCIARSVLSSLSEARWSFDEAVRPRS